MSAEDATTTAWIGHRPLVVQGTAVDGDRVEISLAGPSSPGSTADLYRRIAGRLQRRVMLTVRFTERWLLDTTDSSTVSGRSC